MVAGIKTALANLRMYSSYNEQILQITKRKVGATTIAFDESLIPHLHRIRQTQENTFLEDPEATIEAQMAPYMAVVKEGARIGVAAGSRGIYHYDRMIKKVCEVIKSVGAEPFIIPAMGSHGGATAEGQIEVLKSYGITEETMGAPILSSMETVVLGHMEDGTQVHFDRNASMMDGIILVNRVKPHTDFSGNLGSGIIKQMVIGLGKHKGASTVHRRGVWGLVNVIPRLARIIMEKMPILMGLAILENAQDRTVCIEALLPENLEEREKELLAEAKSLMPSLPFDNLDVLVLCEMGKNISGTGIDPNIVGRYLIRDIQDEAKPHIYRIVCLDLTEESHHNALGVGIADIITRRMFEKIDLGPTYTNTITSGFLERGFIPVVAESDNQAIEIALSCCNRLVSKENARIVFAKNTLDLNELIVSEVLLEEVRDREGVEIIGEEILEWDEEGYLKRKLFS